MMWAGIGLDALTVKKLEPRKRFEKYLSVPEYFATTVWNATLWHGMNLRVSADDKQVEGHYLLAVASNIRHYIGGMAEISPQAYLDDGLMELWLFSGSTLADAFRHFFDMQSGRHLTSDQARCIPFRKACHRIRALPSPSRWTVSRCWAHSRSRSKSSRPVCRCSSRRKPGYLLRSRKGIIHQIHGKS